LWHRLYESDSIRDSASSSLWADYLAKRALMDYFVLSIWALGTRPSGNLKYGGKALKELA
jgi:hypothetical protein